MTVKISILHASDLMLLCLARYPCIAQAGDEEGLYRPKVKSGGWCRTSSMMFNRKGQCTN